MDTTDGIRFEQLTAQTLPTVKVWFGDHLTQEQLGGPDWPEDVMRLQHTQPGTLVDNSRVQERLAWLAMLGDTPVALVDVEVYENASASLAVVVDPQRRGRGLGLAVLHCLLADPRLDHVLRFEGGVSAVDSPGARLLARAGFALAPQPDADGYWTMRWERP